MADVALRFGATDEGLTAQFRRVSQQLSTFERESSRVGQAISASFGKLGAVVGGITLIGATREVLNFADGLTKASAQTGIAVESLQRLQFIAGQVGSSTESIAKSVNRLQVTLVNAGEGSAQATEALSRLGIPIQEFLNLAPDKQFQRVAEQIAAIQNPAERTAAAISLGFKGEVIPALVQTGEQLQVIQGQFSALGGEVSTTAVEAVDNLGDSLGRLKTASISLGTELLGLVSGPITDTIDGINGIIGSVRILAGGGGELERLNRQIDILTESRDSIPIFFNFGYVDQGGLVLGKSELDTAINELIAKRDELVNGTPAAGGGSRGPSTRKGLLRDLGDLSKAPKTGGATAPVASTRELTPEEKRAAADAKGPVGLDFSKDNFTLVEAANQAHIDELVRQWGEFASIRVEQQTVMGSALAALRQEYGIQEINFEELKAASITDIQASIATSGLQIATALFGQNKKVALAVAAINIGVGATEALKLPFPANLAAVAKVLAQGAQLTARIRSASIGGGGGFGGAVGSGSASPAAEPAAASAAAGATSKSATTIYISGFISRNVVDDLVTALRNEGDRDVTIFGSDSRQALDFQRFG